MAGRECQPQIGFGQLRLQVAQGWKATLDATCSRCSAMQHEVGCQIP